MNTSRRDGCELICHYLMLVRDIVNRIRRDIPRHIDGGDLYSVGITGFIDAVRKFDHENGHDFDGYVSTCVREAVLMELRRMGWCLKSHRSIQTLEQSPTTFIPIDQPTDEDDTVSKSLDRAEVIRVIMSEMPNLPYIQRRILTMYYLENMRLAEIAKIFDITESRVCQIHSKTILELNKRLNKAKLR